MRIPQVLLKLNDSPSSTKNIQERVSLRSQLDARHPNVNQTWQGEASRATGLLPLPRGQGQSLLTTSHVTSSGKHFNSFALLHWLKTGTINERQELTLSKYKHFDMFCIILYTYCFLNKRYIYSFWKKILSFLDNLTRILKCRIIWDKNLWKTLF